MGLFPAQCRAARALLGWPQHTLASQSKVDQKTITDFERGVTSPHPRTLEALVKAFEEAGVVFQEPSESEHCGLALRKNQNA